MTIDDSSLTLCGLGRSGEPVTGVHAGSEGFEAYVAARSARLLRTAYLLTQDHGVAEDLVQIALAKAWFAWTRIEGDDPEPYVRKVLVNTYASWRRGWKGERTTADPPDTPAPSTTSSSDERTDVWAALRRLPRRQRAVIVLRFYEDLTEVETARLLDCSVGTVKSQTSKALAKLRIDPALLPSDLSEKGAR